jgi:hypothetical protein
MDVGRAWAKLQIEALFLAVKLEADLEAVFGQL